MSRAMPLTKFKKARGLSQKTVSNIRTGGFMGIELKFIDYGLAASALVAPTDAAGGEKDPATADSISAIAQGDGESNRDGRQAIVKSAYVTGAITGAVLSDQADLQAGQSYYVALVMDQQTNAAQLNSEDVFTNPGAAAVLAPHVLRDLQFTQRFKVLDHVLLSRPVLAAGTDGASTNSVAGFNVPFKLSWNGEMPVNHVGTTAVIASIADNSLHIIAYASSTAGAPAINYNSRVRFVG